MDPGLDFDEYKISPKADFDGGDLDEDMDFINATDEEIRSELGMVAA